LNEACKKGRFAGYSFRSSVKFFVKTKFLQEKLDKSEALDFSKND